MNFKTNADEVIKKLERTKPKMLDAIKRGMVLGTEDFSGEIQEQQMSGRPGLRVGEGTLRGSWYVRTGGVGANWAVKLITNTVYARIHQFGGVIRPVRARFLAFQIKGAGRGPRGGKKTTSTWVFTKKVTIPKRLKIFEAWAKKGSRLLSLRVRDQLRRAIRG